MSLKDDLTSLVDSVSVRATGALDSAVGNARDETIQSLPGHGSLWFFLPADGDIKAEWGITYRGLQVISVGLAGLLVMQMTRRR